MKTFVDILNSYKQNPFMALAICDNTTFEMIGLIVLAASDHDSQLEFIIEVAEKYQEEVITKLCEYYSAYNVEFITLQHLKCLKEIGF